MKDYGVLLGCGCIVGAVHQNPTGGLWADALLHRKPGHGHGPDWVRGRIIRKGDREWPVAVLSQQPFKQRRPKQESIT